MDSEARLINCWSIYGLIDEWIDWWQVVSQQLTKLQDAADKCKTFTKATDAQLKFFQVGKRDFLVVTNIISNLPIYKDIL